jgi:FPC/CPF motif-containing protein YcgG
MIKIAPSHRLFLPTNIGLRAAHEESKFPPGCVRSVESELNRFFSRTGGGETFSERRYQIGLYGKLGAATGAADLKDDLLYFFANETKGENPPSEFFAVFQPDALPETEFIAALLTEVSHLAAEGAISNAGGSASSTFIFSLEGQTFGVRALHPTCPEAKHRFRYPTLVFHAAEEGVLASAA